MAVVFEVRNAGSTTESYRLRCIAEAGVTACRLKETAVTIDGGGRQLIPVWYEAEGNGRVRLEASGRGVRDIGQYVIEPQEPEQGSLSAGGQMSMLGGGGSQAPYVTGHPAAGSYTSPLNVMLEWCGPEGPLEGSGRWVKLNGTTVTGSFSFSSTTQSGCADAYESSGSITLQSGVNNLVTAWICYEPPATQPDCGGGQAGVYQTVTPSAPVVVIDTINPGTRLARAECVISDAGPAAAFQCGDLLVTHSMPAYKALNKDQTLTLLYNSSTAKVQPLVMANIYVPSGTTVPNSFQATLEIPSRSFTQAFSFSSSGAGTGVANTRRLAVSFNDNSMPTGVYPYTLTVRNVYGSSCLTCSTTRSGDLIVVNRSASPFGSGWSIAGLEQIYPGQRNSALLLVGGDGSTAVYEAISDSGGLANAWVAPAGAQRDTIRLATYSRPDSVEVRYYRDLLNGTRIEYNVGGRQTWATARTGQRVEYAYSSDTSDVSQLNYVQIAPHSAVKRYTFAYASSKLDYLTDPAGRILHTTVNTSGHLVDVRDPGLPSANKVVYGYTNGLLTSRRSPSLHTASYAYVNRSSQLASATMPSTQAGAAVNVFRPIQSRGLWQSSGTATVPISMATVVVDGPRAVADSAVFWVNRWGAPYKTRDAAGAITTIHRADAIVPALPTTVVFHNQRRMLFTWNSNGTLAAVRDSTMIPGLLAYGLPTAVTTYQYQSPYTKVLPSSVTDPVNLSTTYVYWPDGQLKTMTGPNQHVTSYGYYTQDGADGRKGQLRSVGERSVQVWNWASHSDAVADSLTTAFTYDSLGNLKSQTNPRGAPTTIERDAKGRVKDVYDALNHRQQMTYDDLNRVLTTVQHDTASTYTTTNNYTIDRLTSVVDPRGVTRTYYHDALGRDTAEADAFGHVEIRHFGIGGQIDSVRTRTHSTIRHTYDAAGRRVKMSFPSPDSFPVVPGDTIRYFHDASGQLDSARNTTYKVRRTYYLNGLLRSEVQSFANGTGASTHFYVYDAAGRRTRYAIGGPVADTVQYNYHVTTGNLQDISIRWRNGQNDLVAFSFDGLGRRKQLTYNPTDPHKLTVNLAYDANGNMVRLCSKGGLGGGLDRYMGKTNIDLDDNVLAINRLGDPNCENVTAVDGGDSIQYDSRHQVIYGDGTAYQYDASGNRTRSDNGAVVVIHAMTPGSNQLASVSYQGSPPHNEFWYNRAGARTAEGTLSFQRLYFYDALGRTSGVLQQAGGGYSGSQISCTYDPLGQVRQPCEGGVTTTIELGYDGANAVRTQHDGASGSWTFVHGPGLDDPLIGMHLEGSSATFAFYVTDGNGRQYAVASRYGYSLSAGGTVGHYRYAGAISNSESFDSQRQATAASPGLSLFRNRLYDQATGRWTQEDPLGVAGGVNLYQYNGNNPASYTDPFGLTPCRTQLCWRAMMFIGTIAMDVFAVGGKDLSAGATSLLKDMQNSSGASTVNASGSDEIIEEMAERTSRLRTVRSQGASPGRRMTSQVRGRVQNITRGSSGLFLRQPSLLVLIPPSYFEFMLLDGNRREGTSWQ